METDVQEAECDGYIQQINNVIKQYRMEIVKVRDEQSGDTKYVYVNLVDTAISRQSQLHSQQNLQFFQLILEKVLEDEDRSISRTDAVNLALEVGTAGAAGGAAAGGSKGTSARMTIGQAEEQLKRWTKENLLAVTPDQDRVFLGFVALAEFEQAIRDKFPDAYRLCGVCERKLMRGLSCDGCSDKIHFQCSGSRSQQQAHGFRCVNCR